MTDKEKAIAVILKIREREEELIYHNFQHF